MSNTAEKQLSEFAKEKRRAYYRKWNAANKDKKREYNRRYWEKKTRRLSENQTAD